MTSRCVDVATPEGWADPKDFPCLVSLDDSMRASLDDGGLTVVKVVAGEARGACVFLEYEPLLALLRMRGFNIDAPADLGGL